MQLYLIYAAAKARDGALLYNCAIMQAQSVSDPDKPLSDDDLIAQAYANVPAWEDAFAALYERHRGRLVRFFLRRGLMPEDAEDGAENCFYKVLDTIDSGKNRFNPAVAPFQAWLYRIARYEFINIVRAKSKYASLSSGDDDREEVRDMVAELASIDEPVDVALEMQQLTHIVQTCISTLKPREREVIALRLAELSHRDVGEIMGITENWAMVLHSLTLGKIRECFFERLRVRTMVRGKSK